LKRTKNDESTDCSKMMYATGADAAAAMVVMRADAMAEATSHEPNKLSTQCVACLAAV
jgi:hypothetical protein